MKKILLPILTLIIGLTLVGCKSDDKDTLEVVATYDYKEIAKWGASVTPGDDSKGTATANDDEKYTRVQVDGDTWGGVQSPVIKIDTKKGVNYIAARIFESQDEYKWTIKFVPSNPIEGHEWGFYLIEDNNFKHNNYAVANINEKLAEFVDAYNGVFEGVLWIWAAGGAEAHVDVSSISLLLK